MCIRQAYQCQLAPRGADQCQRASRRLHLVCGGNIVLQQDRDAVQRTARSLRLALPVEGSGNPECVGIQFND
jgi:hypothetical protein